MNFYAPETDCKDVIFDILTCFLGVIHPGLCLANSITYLWNECVMVMLSEHLFIRDFACLGHCTKHFTYKNSRNNHSNPMKWAFITPIFTYQDIEA